MAGPSKKTEPPELNSVRAHALFDILTHHETAREISAFKLPGTVEGFGPPFSSILAAETNSPILHRLMHTLLLPLPGVSRLSTAEVARAAVDPAEDMPSVKGTSKNGAEERFFWPDLAGGLLSRLASANLSESYDKAALGTRRTLATGYAAVVEGLARGLLGGVNPGGGEGGSKDNSSSYDVTKADDLERGWDDLVRGLVYGDLIDELAGWMTETEDAEGHSEMVAAAAEYSIIQQVCPSSCRLRGLVLTAG